MASVVAYKEVRAWGAMEEELEIIYDFTKDAGAVGALDLFKAKEKMLITKSYLVTETAVVGTNATIEIGKSGDTAGIVAQTALTVVNTSGKVHAGVTNLAYALAADDIVIMTIGTSALTAGKLRIRFHVAGQA